MGVTASAEGDDGSVGSRGRRRRERRAWRGGRMSKVWGGGRVEVEVDCGRGVVAMGIAVAGTVVAEKLFESSGKIDESELTAPTRTNDVLLVCGQQWPGDGSEKTVAEGD